VFAEIKSKEWPNIGSKLLNLKKSNLPEFLNTVAAARTQFAVKI